METGEHQLESWREEQFRIASKVVIPKSATSKTKERYRSVHPSTSASGSLLIGGVDVSFQDDLTAIAVYVILKYNTIDSLPQVVYRSHKWYTLTIPYIPSYLAFREIEPLLELISSQIELKPDLMPNVIMVDGNGQWHERKAGLASCLGVKTGIPTIGVGKKFYSIDGLIRKNDVLRDVRMAVTSWYNKMVLEDENIGVERHGELTSRHLILDTVSIPASINTEGDSAEEAPFDQILATLHRTANGIAIPMTGGTNNDDEVLAYALVGHGGNVRQNKYTQQHSGRGSKNPIYISVGSNIALEDAVALCSCMSIARIPEPIREADLYGRQLVREKQAGG